MRKILSLVLALALVLGSFSFAFAATPSDIEGEACQEAVEKLIGLGIINGYPDGTYRPENVVTRAEMAKIIVISLGLESVAEFANNMSTFTDVEGHWAKKYINVASGKGILKGYPDGTFKPDAEVTYPEAITMMVRALGYNDDALAGTWPINYLTKANDLGITDGVTVKAAGANRGDVAIMLDATLGSEMVTVNKDGDVEGTDDLLVSKVAAAKSYYVTDVAEDVIVADDLDTTDAVEDDEITTLVDMTDYLFAHVNVYVNEDDEIVYVDSVDTETWEGTATQTLDEDENPVSDSYDVEDADEEVKTFELKETTTIRFNGVDVAYGDDIADLVDATVKVVYTTDDEGEVDEITGIVAKKVTEAILVESGDEIDMDEVEDNLEDEEDVIFLGYTLPTVENDDEELELDMDNIIVTGDADELEDIKANDLVYVYVGENAKGKQVKLTFEVIRDAEEGEIEEIVLEDGEPSTVVVDGDEYELALQFDYDTTDSEDFTVPEVGSEVVLVLDENGDVAAFADVEEDEIEENYAVVLEVTDGEKATKSWEDDTLPSVVLLLEDGTTVEYELDLDLDVVVEGTDAEGNTIFTATLVQDDLIKYEINEDEVITRLEEVTTLEDMTDSAYAYDADNMLFANSFLLNEDTIVFDLTSYDTVAAADLESSDYEAYLLVDGDDVKVMMLNTAAVTDTDAAATYALISSISKVKVDDTVKFKVKAYVDGELTTYYTVNDTVADDVYFEVDNFVEFTFDGDEVASVDNYDEVAPENGVVEGEVVKVIGSLVKIGDTFYEVSDEVVVYDITDGAAVADFDDVEEEVIVRLVNFDDDDSVYDYVIILPEAE